MLPFAFVLALAMWTRPGEALACQCSYGSQRTPMDALREYDVIFEGRVAEVALHLGRLEDYGIVGSGGVAHFEIIDPWKGEFGDETTVDIHFGLYSSCSAGFNPGEQMIVFARLSNGALSVELCDTLVYGYFDPRNDEMVDTLLAVYRHGLARLREHLGQRNEYQAYLDLASYYVLWNDRASALSAYEQAMAHRDPELVLGGYPSHYDQFLDAVDMAIDLGELERAKALLGQFSAASSGRPARLAFRIAYLSGAITDVRDFQFAQNQFDELDATGLDLDWSDFHESSLYDADFAGASLRNADFAGAWAGSANFDDADLENAVLNNGSFRGVDLRRANLANVRLDRADLFRARLEGASLSSIVGRDTTFENADLTDADLTGAHLLHPNFRGATLLSTDFSGAHIEQGDFTGADLTDADLSTATLIAPILEGAILSCGSRLPDGFAPGEYGAQPAKSCETGVE
jgi:uncharacterized protein YjbI with pentapeptide repeats